MKKKIILPCIIFLMLVVPVSIFADTGIGGVMGYGQPTGLSLKFNNFPVVSLGWSLSDKWVESTVDYWLFNSTLDKNIKWYIGAGVKMSIGDDFGFIVRVPVGLQWFFVPGLELFGELAPGISLLPNTDRDLSAGIGLRFHF